MIVAFNHVVSPAPVASWHPYHRRCFFLFHLFTALMEAVSIEQEVSLAVIVNAVVRLIVAALFLFYGMNNRMRPR